MTHICVIVSSHCFRYWPVVCAAPSSYWGYCWLFVSGQTTNFGEFQWKHCLKKTHLKMSSVECRPLCSGCSVFNYHSCWRSCWIIWRLHEMKTFSALLALCVGNSPVTGEFASQRPVTRNFDVFFDLRLNKRVSKQSRRRWFETPSPSLWRYCKVGEQYQKFFSSLIICRLIWDIIW